MTLGRLLLAIVLTLVASLELSAQLRGRVSNVQVNSLQTTISGEPQEPAEFYFTRLRYDSFGYRGRGTWSQDYPRADDDCLIVLRRVTRIDAPAPLNVVDMDSDRIFEYPWIYAVGVSNWSFTDDQAKRLHDYLDRGGFLMVDHFHGEDDWDKFMAGMNQVLPNASWEDLPDDDAIFHVLHDINEKFQIPGEVYVNTGRTYEKDGYIPRWRGIRDSRGRINVAITANMHLGDAWEWANTGEYPEKFSGLAFRIVANYIAYAMSH